MDASELDGPVAAHDPRPERPSAATLTAARPLQAEGQVELHLGLDAAEEYRRLRADVSNALDHDASPADDHTATSADPREAEGLSSFIEQLRVTAGADAPTPLRGSEPEDDFVAAFTHPIESAPTHLGSRPSSAALAQHETPPRGVRSAEGLRHRRAWMITVAAGLLVAGILVLTWPHGSSNNQASTHPAATDHAGILNAFRGDLTQTENAANDMARTAVAREQAKATAKAHRRAVIRRQAARHRAQIRRRARHHAQVTSLPSNASSDGTGGAVTTSTPSTAPTTTPTTPTTTAARSTSPASSSRSSTPATHAPAYGDGGLLGAGHSSGSS